MDQLINIIGTYYLSGFVILNVLYLNIRMNDSVNQIMRDTYSEQNVVAISQILEYDIYKVGHSASGDIILKADSTAFTFRSDLDNNNVIDTVFYTMSTPTTLSTTRNPRDFIVYRQVNSSGAKLTVAYSTSLKFTYSDATGAKMSYVSIAGTAQASRNNIKYITTYVKCESSDSLSTDARTAYSPVEWQMKIRPKNI